MFTITMSISPAGDICIGVKTFKINVYRWICTPNSKLQKTSVALHDLLTTVSPGWMTVAVLEQV